MTDTQFKKIMVAQFDYCARLLGHKNQEYQPDETSRFHNFEVAAALQGVSRKEALAAMMAKHTVSLYDMCHEASCAHSHDKWIEKITDHINYLVLLRAMIDEDKGYTEEDYE